MPSPRAASPTCAWCTSWNKGFTENPAHARYESLARDIDRAIKFMASCGADFEELKRVEFYASHEGLLMDYERPMTRIDSRTGTPYNTSAHFLWIGERTRELDGAHVDFLSRVRNPIGVKLGPTTTGDDALRLIDKLDPDREPGRLTFITRMGAGKIRETLPALVEAIKASDATPLWVTDPMHGNTVTTPNGYKTRRFDDVVDEVARLLRGAPRRGHQPGRHARRADRRRRHRVPGRLRADRRGSVPGPLRVALRSAPEPHAVAGDGVPGGRGAVPALKGSGTEPRRTDSKRAAGPACPGARRRGPNAVDGPRPR